MITTSSFLRGLWPVSRRPFACLVVAFVLAAVWPASVVLGQEKDDENKPIDPENVTFDTKDGVKIYATYYASKFKKKAVPIIMLHGWGGNRGEYHPMALFLQTQGYAVIAPDLRGHGQSTRFKTGGGESEDIDPDKMKAVDIKKMVLDVEAVKKFLVEKNNKGELNIEALCVVGSHVGGTIAMMWAAADWSVQSLPSYKQGQDVKALILLSPVESFKGVVTKDPLTHPAVKSALSILICVGKEDAKSHGDAKRLHTQFSRFHGKQPTEEQEVIKKKDLFFVEDETSLQGTKLWNKALTTPAEMQRFLYWRLSLKLDDYPWTERKNPLASE